MQVTELCFVVEAPSAEVEKRLLLLLAERIENYPLVVRLKERKLLIGTRNGVLLSLNTKDVSDAVGMGLNIRTPAQEDWDEYKRAVYSWKLSSLRHGSRREWTGLLMEVVAKSVGHVVKAGCPYCGKQGYHEVADTWDGKRVWCGECGCEFRIKQSEEEAFFDRL